jgi:hypothetical protein
MLPRAPTGVVADRPKLHLGDAEAMPLPGGVDKQGARDEKREASRHDESVPASEQPSHTDACDAVKSSRSPT